MGPESSVYVYNEGRADYTQVVGQLTTCDGAFIVGREPDEDFTLETLRGKSILGGRAGGIPLMTLEYALRQAGLEPGVDVDVRSDVRSTSWPGPSRGEGDYTTLFEPTATEVEQQGEGYVLASVGALAGEVPYTATGDPLRARGGPRDDRGLPARHLPGAEVRRGERRPAPWPRPWPPPSATPP